jgi:hypothetical protein
MTPLVMKIEGMGGGPTPFDGQYLKEYDPGRAGVDPNGAPMIAHVVTTPHKHEAKVFASLVEFHAEWTRVDPHNPVRPDGRPNRPLTAFTVSTEQV